MKRAAVPAATPDRARSFRKPCRNCTRKTSPAPNANFSEQDRAIVGQQNYSSDEKLSHTDAVVIQWRKLVLEGFHVRRVARMLSVQK